MSDQLPTNSIEWLNIELNIRREQNKRYSLRSFADFLGISSGMLSDILSGNRKFSIRLAHQACDALGYDETKRRDFISLVKTGHISSALSSDDTHHSLSDEQHALIDNDLSYPLLNLLDTDNFVYDLDWIARRLRTSPECVQETIDQLESLGVLSVSENKIVAAREHLWSTTEIPSAKIRDAHKRQLQKASDALDETAIDLREFSSVSMAIDSRKIPQAKKLIDDFLKSMMSVLGEGPKDEVYRLGVQFYNLSD